MDQNEILQFLKGVLDPDRFHVLEQWINSSKQKEELKLKQPLKKLAIVVGHNANSQGAVRPDTGETEFVYNGKMAKEMVTLGVDYDLDVKVFYRSSHGGYSAEISRVYAEVDKWGADASIELHFNAAGNPAASGTETLSSGSPKSLALAQEVQMEMVEELGLKDRGIKIRNSRTKGRGYQSLIAGNAPAILTEPFFATSSIGRKETDEPYERTKLAMSILEGANRAIRSFE